MSLVAKAKVNQPKSSLQNYFITVHGEPKFGKTTFAVDLVEVAMGERGDAIILASEQGHNLLAGVRVFPVIDFKETSDEVKELAVKDNPDANPPVGFIEIIDDLVENKALIEQRFVIIDTITAIERMAKSYTVDVMNNEARRRARASRSDKRPEVFSDISDFGFGKGYNRLAEEIYAQIDRLRGAGYGVLAIGHSKERTHKPKNQEEYSRTEMNLEKKVQEIIERESDFLLYGETIVSNNEIDGSSVERKLHIRSDGSVLAGGRLTNVSKMALKDEDGNFAEQFFQLFNEEIEKIYGGDKGKVKEMRKEEETRLRDKTPTSTTSGGQVASKAGKLTKDSSLDEIHERLQVIGSEEMDKDTAVKFAKEIKETLGLVNFKKSDDVEKLLHLIEVGEKMIQE